MTAWDLADTKRPAVEMQDQDPADQTASLRAATVVLEDARTLAASVERYRLILRRAPDRADDMPF